jgi:hypothetical protein
LPQITLPVKRVGDRWEFLYGGDIPVVDGVQANLTISTSQITDEQFLARVNQDVTVKVLNQGTRLLIALTDKNENQSLGGKWHGTLPVRLPPGTTRLEEVFLGERTEQRSRFLNDEVDTDQHGGLWLRIRGLNKSELISSSIVLPEGLDERSAISLNHAFTLLSKKYETHRLSNTGNVYTHVFYQENNSRWYPLSDLRLGVLDDVERSLIRDTWLEVEQKLGWRPVPNIKK